ncbi:MAG: hypothetical protein V1489_02380 [Candidatus Liptonbacteria bacterium]
MSDMELKSVITDILTKAVQAPSGDNSQPWRFEARDNVIDIFNLPEKDNPILNFEQRGSYVAHGALIENISLLSAACGLSAAIAYFPDYSRATLIARIRLSAGLNSKSDSLAGQIEKRHTNRKAYHDAPLTNAERSTLQNAIGSEASGKVFLSFAGEPARKTAIAAAASNIEQVILEHRELHGLLFKDVCWTAAEERSKHSGLYLASMEFALPQKIVFKLASYWPVIKVFNYFGLSRFIASEDAKLYSSGGGFGALLVADPKPEDFLLAGRALERVWLTAAREGLSVQPVIALMFAAMRPDGDLKKYFCDRHIKIIRNGEKAINDSLRAGDKTVAMLFRIGHADPPSAYSTRKIPDIRFL